MVVDVAVIVVVAVVVIEDLVVIKEVARCLKGKHHFRLVTTQRRACRLSSRCVNMGRVLSVDSDYR